MKQSTDTKRVDNKEGSMEEEREERLCVNWGWVRILCWTNFGIENRRVLNEMNGKGQIDTCCKGDSQDTIRMISCKALSNREYVVCSGYLL